MKKSTMTSPGANATNQTWPSNWATGDGGGGAGDYSIPCAACVAGNESLCTCNGCASGGACICCAILDGPSDTGSGRSTPTVTMNESDVDLESGGYWMTKAKLDTINSALNNVRKAIAVLAETRINKGWLGTTSQNDLADSDFLWISDAYRSGKEKNKSAGRKLPVAVHGKVSVDGWMAAWNALHGSRGGADYSGGPSRDEVLRKLMNRKPSGIEVKGGEAHRVSKAVAIPFKKEVSESNNSVEDFQFVCEFKKSDVDIKLGIIFAKASVAGVPDREGDVIEIDELEKAAYDFLENPNKRITNTHNEDIPGAVVASYIDGDSWILGFKPKDIEVAKAAARGDFVGMSIGGTAIRIPIEKGNTIHENHD